jgi:molybdopterin-guanine dinucleotide biosynthesis protein MobB
MSGDAMNSVVPLIGFAAYSATGKTTLLEQLIPILKSRGLRVAVIKHAHHGFDVDLPGKDSFRLRQAGAQQTLVASGKRSVLITEFDDECTEPSLPLLLQQLHMESLNLILVEGFRHEPIPKIELHRPGLGKPLIFPDDEHVIAVATDGPLASATHLPLLDLNDAVVIAEFICVQLLGMVAVDAGRCPLCGELNYCGRVEDSRCEGCWCQAVTIPPRLLEEIPAAARMRACLCRRCVDDYTVHNG